MTPLHRIVYLSRAVGPAASNVLALSEILGASQRNNANRDLTGILVAHDQCFLQVLEGQRPSLDSLLSALAQDPRHKDIRILSDQPIAGRSFAEWRMGQAVITPALAERLKGQLLDRLSAPEAHLLLADCADDLRAVAA